jgi:hypothetical protein
MMGTLKGFPNPPAMGSDEQSSSSPDAIESGASSGKAGLPSLSR